MHFQILTLFPDFFSSPLQASILQKAQEKKIFSWGISNIRDFSDHPNKNIDDVPYGGGGGMLIQADPVAKAIADAKKNFPDGKVIFFSPTGEKFSQEVAQNFADDPSPKILLCGHYEGIDQRVLSTMVEETICVGESIQTGGEIPALSFIDSIVRLIPEGIGNKNSHENDTFSENFYGKGEYPQYTRPQVWNGLSVPKILISGDEKKIEDWRFDHLQNLDDNEEKIVYLRRKKFSQEKPYKISQKNSTGEKISLLLQVPEKNDIESWYKWFNDSEVTKFMRLENCSWQDEIDYFNFQHFNLHILLLSIRDKKSGKTLGNVSWEITPEFPYIGNFGIVIGEKNFWNKGIGKLVVREMLNIAKKDLELQKVTLDCFAENFAAQKIYEQCGFTKIGIRKHHYKKGGKFFDALMYEKVL